MRIAAKKLWALSRKELLLLARDPHGLLVLFAVPALFILLMSLALRDAFSPERQAPLPLAVINEDGAPLSLEVERNLAALPGFVLNKTEAQVRVRLLPGFSELLATRHDFAADYLAGTPEPALLALDYAASLLPQARAAAELALRQSVQAVQTEYLLETVLGYPKDNIVALRYVNDPRHLPVEHGLLDGAPGAVSPSAVQHSVPGWLIFAMFFSVIPLATSFVVERMEGSLLRLQALGVPPWLLIASKALPYYLVHLAQAALMLAIGMFLVPRLGGEALLLPPRPGALLVIVSACSAAALGLALLVAATVRTTVQATIAGGALSLLLAAAGGIMVPKMVMSAAMQAATLVSPMSWALDGFWDLLLRGGGLREVLPEAAALALFGVLALAMAVFILRHKVLSSAHE